MNRTDRLLAIVLELQGRTRVTAEELANIFEVTKRTIYRDIQALNEGGVPVVSAAGQGYWLMEGYFLPPVSFSPDEAVMLVLGSDLMAQSFDAQYKAAAQSASRKIEALLTNEVQQEVSYLKENIRFIHIDPHKNTKVPELLQKIRRAILERTSLNLHYTKKAYGKKGEASERKVDPHSLLHLNGNWILVAYCHLRRDIRMFRLDRIDRLELTSEVFKRQKDFSVEHLKAPHGRNVLIELLFDKDISQWVKERPTFFISHYEDLEEGLKVTLKARSLEESLAWILSWGAKVKVLSPEVLKEQIRQELQAMLANVNHS